MGRPRKKGATSIQPKFSTVDAAYKLIGSLPLPRQGRSVATMDKFVSIELHGKVINDSPPQDAATTPHSRNLSFFLDYLFAGFSDDFADVTPESLILPLSSDIPAAVRGRSMASYCGVGGSESMKLYDEEKKRWKWNLPLTATEQPADSTQAAYLQSLISDDPKSLTSEQQVALFFNSLTEAFLVKRAKDGKVFPEGPHRQWLGSWSKTPLPGSTGYKRKPDLILIDGNILTEDEITWLSPKAIAEYTKETYKPASRIGKTLDTKAYLVLVEQPWRRFVLGLSLANSELRVHFYDRSGAAVSSPFNIHSKAQHFLFLIVAITLGSRTSIGFDSTIEIHPPSLLNHSNDCIDDGLDFESAETASSSCYHQVSLDPPIIGSLPSLSTEPDDEGSSIPDSPPAAESSEGSLPGQLTHSDISHAAPVSFTQTFYPDADSGQAIGTIRVENVLYDIIRILFSSTGFVGRGTVCYLARFEGVNYVIKDHWVRSLDPDALCNPLLIHEARMMNLVKGIDGVPILHQVWVVENEEGVSDATSRYRQEKDWKLLQSIRTHVRLAMTPCARPLTMFKSKHELVRCIRDVIGSKYD